MNAVLSIDIGTKGAIAWLSHEGELFDLVDMPILLDGPKGRPTVNAALLAGIIRARPATHPFIESVGARPGEGAVGAFAFGRSRGVVGGVLGAIGVPYSFMTPASWKKAVGLSKASKDASRSEAIRRWPQHSKL